MNFQMKLAVMRPVCRRLLPAALGGLLVLGGAAAARAEGRVTFKKLAAESCREMGSCEWRLTCKIGGQAEQEVLPTSKVVAAGSVDLDKSYDAGTFPATVACTLWEDDGWFSASWDEAGKVSLEVPGGGEYELSVGNEAEGAVKVTLTVDSLEAGASPPPPAPAKGKAPAPRLWVGVYEKLPEGRAVLAGLPWDTFQARAGQLTAKGSRLVVLETYSEGGRRLWNGIFESGHEKGEIVHGLDWKPFAERYKNLFEDGMRLVNLVIYDEAGKRLYDAVFVNGYDQARPEVGMTRVDFDKKVMEYGGKGLRLVDFDIYSGDRGQRLYAGAFREGVGSYGLWPELGWDAFYEKWKSGGEGGATIGDLETYTEKGKRLFAAAIRGGGQAHLEPPAEWPAFAAKWKELAAKGMRLVDLETY